MSEICFKTVLDIVITEIEQDRSKIKKKKSEIRSKRVWVLV